MPSIYLLLPALAVLAIMVTYYYEPLQALKAKTLFRWGKSEVSINKLRFLGFNKVMNCAICFSFWSSFIILALFYYTYIVAFLLALICSALTAWLTQYFIKW